MLFRSPVINPFTKTTIYSLPGTITFWKISPGCTTACQPDPVSYTHLAGKQVLAVDKDQELVQEIADYVTYAARADVTDSRVFESLGISNMDVVIIGISEDMELSLIHI